MDTFWIVFLACVFSFLIGDFIGFQQGHKFTIQAFKIAADEFLRQLKKDE